MSEWNNGSSDLKKATGSKCNNNIRICNMYTFLFRHLLLLSLLRLLDLDHERLLLILSLARCLCSSWRRLSLSRLSRSASLSFSCCLCFSFSSSISLSFLRSSLLRSRSASRALFSASFFVAWERRGRLSKNGELKDLLNSPPAGACSVVN